jgi:hypothetical protein
MEIYFVIKSWAKSIKVFMIIAKVVKVVQYTEAEAYLMPCIKIMDLYSKIEFVKD